jgi:hypothetical protein
MLPMMDEEDSQVPIWSYRVNLDKRVRDDHPLRRIRAAIILIIKDLRGQVVSDSDQSNVGSNRQRRAQSGGPLNREVLKKRGRNANFSLLGRIAVSTLVDGPLASRTIAFV